MLRYTQLALPRTAKQEASSQSPANCSNQSRPPVADPGLAVWIDFGILRCSMAEESAAVNGLPALFSRDLGGWALTCGYMVAHV